MLPKADGFTVAQRLRRAHVGTPILLLTARDAISDKICGYDSGADDYMTKPFSPAELLARSGRPHAAPGRCRLRDAHRGRSHAES